MSNDIALYKQQMLEAAGEYTDVEKLGGGAFITTRNGVLRLGEEELPGNQTCVVILDSVFENTLYEGRFNAEKMEPPVCYAFARREEDLAPHPSMQEFPEIFFPQNDTCKGCEFAEWGSGDTGRGKACQNRRRLAVIPAGQFIPVKGTKADFDLEIYEGEDHYMNASMALLKLPVTSTTAYSKFVHDIANEYQLPPFGVIARIWLEPDPKKQYTVNFEVIEPLADDCIRAILARHEEAKERIITPYRPFEEMDDKGPSSNARAGLRGLRKGK